MGDRVGQQLGNYKLIRLLGRGGFADVYLGEHIFLKTQAAIKVQQTQMTQQDLQSFLKEAQTIATLKHPHIVRVLDFGVDSSTPFLVMDFADQGTLRERHPRGSTLPMITIVSYVRQIASALYYAHSQSMVHRDIKPENMLVDVNNTLLLSDFGIAIMAHKTQSLSTQEAIGTIAYMSPEQIRGKARPASDQYSLGVIVYEWLCGVRPFDGSASIEIAMHHLSDPPPPLPTKLSTISPIVDQIVQKALKKDPQQRFESIIDFAIALEEVFEKEMNPSITAVEKTKEQRFPFSIAPTILVKTKDQQLLEEGNSYYREQHYQDALRIYTQAITLNPLYSTAYNNRGLAYKNLRRYKLALRDFDQAIALDPTDTKPYNNRGLVYYALQQYKEAISDYDHAIALNSRFTLAHHNRALVYEVIKQYEQAISDYQRILAIDPTDSMAFSVQEKITRLLRGQTK